MYKKLIIACAMLMAITAATASASPVFTDDERSVPVGASVQLRSTGVFVSSGGGVMAECSSSVLSGTVTENSGTSIKLEIPVGSAKFTGTGTSEDCTTNLGSASFTVNSALCFATISKTDTVTVTGCGGKAAVYSLSITGTGVCKYSAATVTGTFTTGGAPTVKFSNQPAKKVEGGIFCPSESVLNVDWDLYTTDWWIFHGSIIT
jgi:hypothetical protein